MCPGIKVSPGPLEITQKNKSKENFTSLGCKRLCDLCFSIF